MPVPSASLDVGRFEALAALQIEGEPDVLAEMVGLFEGEARTWMAEARRAAGAADMVMLGRVAHGLKGVCGAIGARRMRALAVRLEEELAAPGPPDTDAVLDAMNDEFERLMDLLHGYVPRRREDHRSAPADQCKGRS